MHETLLESLEQKRVEEVKKEVVDSRKEAKMSWEG